MSRNFTGYTASTKESLLLNAGAFFKNYDFEKDTYESALKAGKCLGATQGGGSFVATPEVRNIEIDGADPEPVFDGWTTSISANLIEVKPETLKASLGSGVIIDDSDTHFKIRAKRLLSMSDFIDNITWIGTLSGSDEPVIIQIFNVVNTTGLTINVAPKSQSVLAVTFTAKSDIKNTEDMDFAPFIIYYPKSVARIEFEQIFAGDTNISGSASTGATVHISGGTIPPESETIAANGKFNLEIPAQTAGAQIVGYQEIKGRRSLDAIIYVDMKPEEPEDEEEE